MNDVDLSRGVYLTILCFEGGASLAAGQQAVSQPGDPLARAVTMIMRHIQCGGARSPLSRAHADGVAQSAGEEARDAHQEQPVQEYEPPAVMVLGSVLDLTAGSTASGHADANSQYYW